METQEMRSGVFCQSCGMPLGRIEDFGINGDGSRNKEYCVYCYQQESFTVAGITLEQMIYKYSHIMNDMKVMGYEDAKEMNGAFLPTLRRWKH